MKKLSLLLVLLLLVSGSILAQQVANVSRPMNVPSFIGYVQNEFIIKFKPSVGTPTVGRSPQGTVALGLAEFDRVSEQYDVDGIREQFPGAKEDPRGADFSRYYVVRFNQGTLDEAMGAYWKLPEIELVEPIAIHAVMATPNDGFYAQQWHLNRANDQDMDGPEAWDVETGEPTKIVAILDTGVRYYHKDLGGSAASSTNPTAADGNMWLNTAEKNGVAGVDDDGNGYVDDWVGWDFVSGVTGCWSGEDCSTADNDPRDFNGHGTHCAGNVGAMNNNGYASCSPSGGWGTGTNTPTGNGVKVMALRIGYSGSYFGQEVGFVRMDFAASAFYYAARNGARIASCSWGSSNTSGLGAAIDTFLARGGLIFKAAGNDGTQTADYMCGRTDIVSVAALDTNGCKADFSTYGTWVDISAPGTGILSSYHNHSDAANDYVATLDGTSMATPLTASVAALIWSKNPTWTAAQVKTQLLAAVDTISNLSCNSSYAGRLGSGRVNAFKAVNTGAPCPLVANFTGTPTSGCAPLAVTFTDASTGGATSWSWTFGDGGTSTAQNPSYTYTAAGTYTVALTVGNGTCQNTLTRTNYITVSAVPTAAFSGTPTSGNAPLTVTFTNSSTGNPTSYSWDFGDGGTSIATSPVYTYNTPGTYTVTLTATNGCGSDQEIKTNYITVNTPPAQQCDDFADGDITNWLDNLGTWIATGGYMNGNSNTLNSRRTSPFGTFSTATIDCDVRMNSGRNQRNARIIWAYIDGNNYRFAQGDDVGNTWRLYTRVGGTNTLVGSWAATIATATWYHVQVVVASNGTATLKVGGATIGSYAYGTSVTGKVGVGYNRAISDFDNFCVGSSVSALAEVSSPQATAGLLAKDYTLAQNYPNPFNPSTTIEFTLPVAGDVSLEVYNVLGQRVAVLAEGYFTAGAHQVIWDASTVSTGVYLYRLRTPETSITRKMLLIK